MTCFDGELIIITSHGGLSLLTEYGVQVMLTVACIIRANSSESLCKDDMLAAPMDVYCLIFLSPFQPGC